MWLINIHNGTKSSPPVNIDSYPDIKEHLDKFYPALEKRQDKGITPYHLRSCIYTEDFSKQKIVWGEISDNSKFAFDDTGIFPEATTFLMTGSHLKFILAILNSKLGEWLFNQIGTTTGMGTNRWKKYKLETLIVKAPTKEEQIEIEKLIDIISFQRVDIEIIKKDIDRLVYKLYDLSEEEIGFIESL